MYAILGFYNIYVIIVWVFFNHRRRGKRGWKIAGWHRAKIKYLQSSLAGSLIILSANSLTSGTTKDAKSSSLIL